MAYNPILNDVLEARIYTFDPAGPPQVGVNVVHYRVTGVALLGQTQAQVAAGLDAAIAALYKAVLSNQVMYRGVTIQKVWPRPVVAQEGANGNAGAGTGGVGTLPSQVAPLIKNVTAKAGRAFRGRLYTCFPPQPFSDVNGNLTNAGFAALGALGGAIFAQRTIGGGGNTITIAPTIWHRKGYGTPPVAIGADDLMTGSFASPLFATQRKRGNYGRTNPSSPI